MPFSFNLNIFFDYFTKLLSLQKFLTFFIYDNLIAKNELFILNNLHKFFYNLDKLDQKKLAWSLFIICPGFFASNMVMARAMADVMPPMTMALTRWLFVSMIIFAFCWPWIKTNTQIIFSEWKHLIVLGGFGMGLCGGPVYLAGEYTSATNIGLIYASSPLLILLISVFFLKEKISFVQIVGFLMGVLGVLLILVRGNLTTIFFIEFNKGDLWICSATLSFALYSLGLKYFKTRIPSIVRIGLMSAAGVLWHLPFTIMEFIFWNREFVLSAQMFQGLFILIFISSFAAYVSYSKIIAILGAAKAGMVLYLSPIYVAIFAILLLGENLAWFHIIGCLLIIPGVWLTSLKSYSER